MSYFIAFICGVVLFRASRFFPLTALALVPAATALYILKRQAGSGAAFSLRALGFPLALALIATSGFFYARASHHAAAAAVSGPADRALLINGTVQGEGTALRSRPHLVLHTVTVHQAVNGDSRAVALKEAKIITDSPLVPDDRYEIRARLWEGKPLLNPGSPGRLWNTPRPVPLGHAVSVRRDVEHSPGIFAAARMRLRAFIKEAFSARTAAFLLSIIIGERALLPKETRDAFNATGLAHLLSISGAHFGLLLFVVFGLLRAGLRRLPSRALLTLSLYGTPSQAAALLSVPFIVAYLGISAESYPALRAFIMIALFLFGLLLQRRRFWRPALLIAAAVILLLAPDAYTDISFQLSFIAVLCIGLAAERAFGRARPREEGERRASRAARFSRYALTQLKTSALLSCAATFGTAPLVAYSFHYVSIISPVANLVITPFIGLLVLPLALVSSFIFLLFGAFPFQSLLETFTSGALSLIERTAQLSGASVAVPAFPPVLLVFFYGALVVFAATAARVQAGAQNNKAVLLFRILPLCAAGIPFIVYAALRAAGPERLCVTFLDVGQGDASVVELPDGAVLVVDTGSTGLQVADFLRSRGIRAIDALALSHGQSDHAGGLAALFEEFTVRELWDNGRLLYSESPESPQGIPGAATHRRLSRGDVLSGSGYSITVLHPSEGFSSARPADPEQNNDSLVLRIQGRSASFLFTGDIEREGQESLLPLEGHLKSTVLKAPHHGSRSSATAAFFAAVSPEAVVISVGRGNRYGHPGEEVLSLLADARVFRTDRDGAVGICETSGAGLQVKRAADGILREPGSVRDEVANFKNLFLLW